MKKFSSCPQLSTPQLPSETAHHIYPQRPAYKKCHSLNNVNKLLSEYILVKAAEELDFVTLHFLLKSPRNPLDDRVILRIVASLVYCNFIPRMSPKTIEKTRLTAIMTFRTLLNKIPMSKYPLIAEFIAENLWQTQDERGIATIWPLKFLTLLIDRGYNLLNGGKFLTSLYKNCWNFDGVNPEIKSNTLEVTARDYNDIKKIALNLFEEDENFGSKVFPNFDIIVREQKCCNASHMQLIFKVVKVINNRLSLAEQCRKVIRENMDKNNIVNTLTNLELPNDLLVYLMHMDTNENNENNIVFELKFLSTNVLSWEVHRLNTMLARLETRMELPKDTAILKLNINEHGKNHIYK